MDSRSVARVNPGGPCGQRATRVGHDTRLARGGTGEGTTPHKSHVSHTSHRMVKPDPLAMRGVNGRGWDRTSVPRVKRVHRETRLCPDMPGTAQPCVLTGDRADTNGIAACDPSRRFRPD